MTKRYTSLNISKPYCPTWGTWEGVRELMQNWWDGLMENGGRKLDPSDIIVKEVKKKKDDCYEFIAYLKPRTSEPSTSTNASEILGRITYKPKKDEKKPSCLEIINYGIVMKNEFFQMGSSTKRGRKRRVGGHGEGMKVGINALLRQGKTVYYESDDKSWHFDYCNPEKNSVAEPSVLAFIVRSKKCTSRAQNIHAFVRCLLPSELSFDRFLFLRPALPTAKISSDDESFERLHGYILNGNEYKGMLFVKGIFVTRYILPIRPTVLDFGYCIEDLALGRDRGAVVSEDDLSQRICHLWQAVIPVSSEYRRLYLELLNRDEIAQNLDTRKADRHLSNRPDIACLLFNELVEQHGRSTWFYSPASGHSTAEEKIILNSLQRKPTAISALLWRILRHAKLVLTPQEARERAFRDAPPAIIPYTPFTTNALHQLRCFLNLSTQTASVSVHFQANDPCISIKCTRIDDKILLSHQLLDASYVHDGDMTCPRYAALLAQISEEPELGDKETRIGSLTCNCAARYCARLVDDEIAEEQCQVSRLDQRRDIIAPLTPQNLAVTPSRDAAVLSFAVSSRDVNNFVICVSAVTDSTRPVIKHCFSYRQASKPADNMGAADDIVADVDNAESGPEHVSLVQDPKEGCESRQQDTANEPPGTVDTEIGPAPSSEIPNCPENIVLEDKGPDAVSLAADVPTFSGESKPQDGVDDIVGVDDAGLDDIVGVDDAGLDDIAVVDDAGLDLAALADIPIVRSMTGTSVAFLNTVPGREYLVQVRPKPDGWLPDVFWSQPFIFHGPLAAPEALPTTRDGSTVTLQWKASPAATAYRVILRDEHDGVLLQEDVTSDSEKYTYDSALHSTAVRVEVFSLALVDILSLAHQEALSLAQVGIPLSERKAELISPEPLLVEDALPPAPEANSAQLKRKRSLSTSSDDAGNRDAGTGPSSPKLTRKRSLSTSFDDAGIRDASTGPSSPKRARVMQITGSRRAQAQDCNSGSDMDVDQDVDYTGWEFSDQDSYSEDEEEEEEDDNEDDSNGEDDDDDYKDEVESAEQEGDSLRGTISHLRIPASNIVVYPGHFISYDTTVKKEKITFYAFVHDLRHVNGRAELLVTQFRPFSTYFSARTQPVDGVNNDKELLLLFTVSDRMGYRDDAAWVKLKTITNVSLISEEPTPDVFSAVSVTEPPHACSRYWCRWALRSSPDLTVIPLHRRLLKNDWQVSKPCDLPLSPPVIDLFCGAGGSSQGFCVAGFEISIGVDKSTAAHSTYSKHFPGAETYCQPVDDFLTDVENSFIQVPQAPVLLISTPCQGFSTANPGGKNDEENKTQISTVGRAARVLRPSLIFFENVLGLLHKRHQAYLHSLLVDLLQEGYSVTIGRRVAADYGVPQKRPRVILMAAQSGLSLPAWPTPLGTQRTVQDVIGDLVQPNPRSQPAAPSSDTAGGYKTEGGGLVWNHNTGYRPQSSKQWRVVDFKTIAETIRTYPTDRWACKHPERLDALTVRELARIMTLKDSHRFFGSLADQYKLVGNAVAPSFAAAFAFEFQKILSQHGPLATTTDVPLASKTSSRSNGVECTPQ